VEESHDFVPEQVTGIIEVLVESLGDLVENNDKMVRNFLESNTQLEKDLLESNTKQERDLQEANLTLHRKLLASNLALQDSCLMQARNMNDLIMNRINNPRSSQKRSASRYGRSSGCCRKQAAQRWKLTQPIIPYSSPSLGYPIDLLLPKTLHLK